MLTQQPSPSTSHTPHLLIPNHTPIRDLKHEHSNCCARDFYYNFLTRFPSSSSPTLPRLSPTSPGLPTTCHRPTKAIPVPSKPQSHKFNPTNSQTIPLTSISTSDEKRLRNTQHKRKPRFHSHLLHHLLPLFFIPSTSPGLLPV